MVAEEEDDFNLQGGGDGEGHSHANSDDPLAWLKESIPGVLYCSF